ncbi:MAG: ABC transporter substrate-binding protein [Sciscionella sp.]
MAVSATACGGGGGGNPLSKSSGASHAPSGTVVVGSTNFPEQLLLANMYAEDLKAHGVKVQTRLNLGSREVVFPSLKSGDLSVIPEYTGALLGYLVKGKTKATSQQQVLADLKSNLPKGIVALKPSPAQDKDALVVTRQTAQKYHLKTISDLKSVAPQMVVGGPPELKTRFIGLPGLKKVYGVQFKSFLSLDAGGPLTKNALKKGDIQAARLFTTDSSIAKNDWVALIDDKNLIPAQNILPVIRSDANNPTVTKVLNALSAKLTTDTVTKLNAKVEIDKQDADTVAKQWLKQEGLMT